MAKRILLPLDQSQTAEAAVPLVAGIARDSGASVRLLYVAPQPQTHLDQMGRAVAYADQEMARMEAEGLDYLRTMEMQFAGAATECVVRFGDPLAEIVLEAQAFDADLIAVATSGRSAIGRLALGSIAEQVLSKAEASVLLVRPGRKAF